MILGRNAGLWAALVAAGVNLTAAGALVISGHPLGPDVLALFASVNAFGLVVVGLIANASDPTTVPTLAPTLQERRGQTPTAGVVADVWTGPDRRNGGPVG